MLKDMTTLGVRCGDSLFCMETTGAYELHLCDYLYGKGYDVWRESALQIKWSTGVTKAKNDNADSERMARYVPAGLGCCRSLCSCERDAAYPQVIVSVQRTSGGRETCQRGKHQRDTGDTEDEWGFAVDKDEQRAVRQASEERHHGM